MNQSLSPISDPRNEGVEVSRRLYRSMMETTRQLDDLRSYAKTTKDLFSTQSQLLRTKLREIAERLLFSSSLIPSQKVEEILWRKGFYEDVSAAKRLRKDNQWLPEERSQLVLHLKCGVGFYHHLLLCFQTEFGISSGCIDFPFISHEKAHSKSKVPSYGQLEAARDSIHRCLICLGDLNRYLMDIPPSLDSEMAYRYYHQALSWNPDFGMPHNQLGTLSLSKNCNLDAVYHFMRCLMCKQSFEGADRNLKRSFERNSQKAAEEKAVSSGSVFWRCYCLEPGVGQLSESQDHIQRFITHFLLLADVWFFDKRPVPNISDLCHQTLLDFRYCLTLPECQQPCDDSFNFSVKSLRSIENFPSHLSKDMVLKVVVMSLICLDRLRNKGSDQMSSAVAFILALFCILIQQVQENFEDSVFNLSLPSLNEQDSIESVVQTNGNHTETNKILNGTESVKENGHHDKNFSKNHINGDSDLEVATAKPKKRKKVVRRRHRRHNQSDNSDESDDEERHILSSSSDVSEEEDVVLDLSSDDDEVLPNGDHFENGDEDVVVLEVVNEADEILPNKNFVNGHNTTNSEERKKTLKKLNPEDLLEQVAGEGLLPVIKVCADWLQGDKTVVEACGRDSLDMLKNFVNLINLINIDFKNLEKDPANKLFLKHRSILESGNKVPLSEDAQLQNLPFLSEAHADLDWDMIRQNCLVPKEEALLRIQKLVNFCHFLETIPETKVRYVKETGCFHVDSQKNVSKSATSPASQTGDSTSDLQRREEIMQNMGQLWLRAEVQDLETSVKRGCKGATFSPFLVLDVDALTKYYHVVGQLMASRKFIMVVPSIVLTALDQLKRESVLARDAIRWLEFQFQKGSRFLRAQTINEALQLPLVSYPKQKSREAWTYFKVLECCHYLNSQSTLARSKGSEGGYATLLTGHNWSESSEFSPIGVAKAVGITVEHIESFFAKWKTSSKSHG